MSSGWGATEQVDHPVDNPAVFYAIRFKLSLPLGVGEGGSRVDNLKIIEIRLFKISVNYFSSSKFISLILLGFHDVLCQKPAVCWGWGAPAH